MNAVRIRKHLTAPIPELPELAPLVGKTVEIIVLEEPDPPEAKPAPRQVGYDFWNPPTLKEIQEAQGVKPITSIDELKGEGFEDAFDGFEETLREWRQEPWRREDD